MVKISNQELLSAIFASQILTPYMEQDASLAALIQSPNHPDIHYFDKPAPAKDIAPTLKRRLGMMAAKNISHNFDATKHLVEFMDEHPDSEIYNVTFNGQQQHYGVRCSLIDSQIHVICVMTGGRIPDELLGETTP